jgi:chorismate mutase
MLRGIRGAITVKKNSKAEILSATTRLLTDLMGKNGVKPGEIASIFFTVTGDLNAEFPARAARLIGMNNVPLMCAVEINVPKSLKKCIRVLMHVNTGKSQDKIKPVYLEGAVVLRKEFST